MAKSHLRVVAPTEVKRTVAPKRAKNAELRTREYFAPDEVEALIEAAKGNRYGHRDATVLHVRRVNKAEVDARGDAARGDEVAVLDDPLLLLGRADERQRLGVAPMGGRPFNNPGHRMEWKKRRKAGAPLCVSNKRVVSTSRHLCFPRP
jgi:hypothetical protein